MHVCVCVYFSLPTDVAETVYSVGAQDDHGWASLLHTYKISLSEAQKHKLLYALASSKDTSKLEGYFVFMLLLENIAEMLPPCGKYGGMYGLVTSKSEPTY